MTEDDLSTKPLAPFTIHHIDTVEGRRTWRAMITHAPHVGTLINYIDARQAAPSERVLRWYQRELFESRFFRIPSPVTACMIRSGDAITVTARKSVCGQKTVFRFPDAPDLLLCASNLGEGFPLNTILMPSLRCGLNFGTRTWTISPEEAEDAIAIFATEEWQPVRPATNVAAVCGDPNFAHMLWNQLPALREAAGLSRRTPPPTTVTFFEPLGDIGLLVPDIAHWPVERPAHYAMPNAPGRALFCFGSTQIDPQTRAALLRSARDAIATDGASALAARLEGRHPIVWVSVRTRDRTPVNQREFLTGLIGRLLAIWPNAVTLLDGHSIAEDVRKRSATLSALPAENDCEDLIAQESAKSLQTAARDAEEVAAILRAVETETPAYAGRVIDVSNLSILNSIALAARADFYICHHGSVQHKIGWTTSTPGVTHSNRRVIQRRPAHWVMDQAGHDTAPVYFPEDLIMDIVDTAPALQDSVDDNVRSLHSENYQFADVTAAIDFTLEELARVHARPPVRQ
ncbi:hypothetical protein [Acetobacter sp. DsW_063]|uniref:hypothetical protein n=1 Tax=Acetobacter sp. DsW_063 TaxID=1514894 RepID=UPI000A3A8CC9|nr:hypothetical protein [Acetobacter sp. DsW_063]OUJ14419.1 hypothetical protein HK28_13705 [Acetobacter sp. DsW_063]